MHAQSKRITNHNVHNLVPFHMLSLSQGGGNGESHGGHPTKVPALVRQRRRRSAVSHLPERVLAVVRRVHGGAEEHHRLAVPPGAEVPHGDVEVVDGRVVDFPADAQAVCRPRIRLRSGHVGDGGQGGGGARDGEPRGDHCQAAPVRRGARGVGLERCDAEFVADAGARCRDSPACVLEKGSIARRGDR
ncbi:unnamed protein product [Musa acuminata subsp. malaccensis]|uniref:(wild Malaysian banana) hypothetical protein n=1 Tax=Musa acuminata subsp. malaccensis TaxID=214687 RepID=A0A8D7BBW6_MUSAM|nr:unnamed protein product [Musa acuminata subsp. malaccensis]